MVRVDIKLLQKAKEIMPETRGMTYSGLVELLIRKALNEEKQK